MTSHPALYGCTLSYFINFFNIMQAVVRSTSLSSFVPSLSRQRSSRNWQILTQQGILPASENSEYDKAAVLLLSGWVAVGGGRFYPDTCTHSASATSTSTSYIQRPAPTLIVPLLLAVLVIPRPAPTTALSCHEALRSCVLSIFTSILFYAVAFES